MPIVLGFVLAFLYIQVYSSTIISSKFMDELYIRSVILFILFFYITYGFLERWSSTLVQVL